MICSADKDSKKENAKEKVHSKMGNMAIMPNQAKFVKRGEVVSLKAEATQKKYNGRSRIRVMLKWLKHQPRK